MREPIRVGDLVYVLRGCCIDRHVGEIRVVSRLYVGAGPCTYCGTNYRGVDAALLEGINGAGYVLGWLKRIPPLSDLEGQKDSSGLDERHEFYEALRKMAEGLRS